MAVPANVSGTDNPVADALSRNQMALFRSLCPQACGDPVSIPVEVLDVLVVSKPDWTSPSWSGLWRSYSERAWPQLPGEHMR